MAFNVRITGYTGVVKARLALSPQESTDSFFLLNQPYEFTFVATSNAGAPVILGPSTFPLWRQYSTLCRVEVPPGQSISYEVNNPQRNVAPSGLSPTIVGIQNIQWGPGWFLSFIEAGSVSPVGVSLVSESGPFLTSETGTQLVPP